MKKTVLLIGLVLTTISAAMAQEVMAVVEEQARYIGGESAMREYLVENLKIPVHYTEKAEGYHKVIYMRFVVGTDSCIRDVRVANQRDVPADLQEAAREVVLSWGCDHWISAKQMARPVNMAFKLPLTVHVEPSKKYLRKKRKKK
ncbi:MAG: hypothetical protein JJ975_15255 [Bacteroidia bacterium]|nr:hypothetical protein [Bacteroidia bacterium]